MLSRRKLAALLVLGMVPLAACGNLHAQSTTSGSGSVSQGSSGVQWGSMANVTSGSSSTSVSLGGTVDSTTYSSSPSSYSGLQATSTTGSNPQAGTNSTTFTFSNTTLSGSVNLSFQTEASFSGGGSGGTVTVNYSVNGGSWQSAYGTGSSTSGFVSSSVSISGLTNLDNLKVQLYVVAAPGGPGSTAEMVSGSIQSIKASFSSNGSVYPVASSVLTVSSLGLSVPSGLATTITSVSASINGVDVGAQATLQAQFTVGGSNIGSAQSLPMYCCNSTAYALTGLNGVSLTSAQASSLGITLSASVPAGTATTTQVSLSGFKVTINYMTAVTTTVQIKGSETILASAGAWDAGIVAVSVNGYSKSARYGQGSTPASIASMLAAYFSRDCNSPAGATVSGSTITFYLRNGAQLTQLSATEQSIYAESSTFSASYTADSGQPVGSPVITDMSPAQGITGTTVTLTGSNFGTSGTALFNEASITPSLWSNSTIVFNIPSGAQSGEITLSTATGDTSSGIFTVLQEGQQKTADVYGYALTYQPNGNIASAADEVNGTWSYSYDNLNRLYAAVPGSGAASGYAGHSLCMYYDDFGNRTQAGFQTAACSAPPTPGSAPPAQTAIYNSANHITTNFYEYDEAGNVIYDGVNWYAYDNENRLCAVQTDNAVTGTVATGYLYDAEGRRIAKGAITAMTNPLPTSSSPLSASMCNPATNGFAPTETYVLGQSGEQLSTYSWSGPAGSQTSTWVRTNVYGADGLLATYDVDGQGQPALHFLLTDQVGTRRMQTNPAGTPESECQSLPYGDGLNCFAAPNAPGTADQANALYFTGKQRDPESGGGSAYTGNDYFGARYYASSAGRFMSPDPSSLAYADPTNPQSLNLYSYVLNNPVGFVDPDGLECVWDDGSFDSKDDAVTGSQAGCEGQGGQYINPVAFGTLGLGDWSGQASSYVSFVANALGAQTNVTNVQVNADGSGSVQQSYTNVSDGLQYQMQNNFSWAGDPSLELATAVMSQGIPKVCAVGVNLSLRKYSANVSVSGNGVGATAGDHSVGTSAPQNTGTGKNTVPIGGSNGTVPFSVYHNSKGVMNGITSVSADLKVKKVGVSPYINIGTYTPNLSDPQNCP